MKKKKQLANFMDFWPYVYTNSTINTMTTYVLFYFNVCISINWIWLFVCLQIFFLTWDL